MCRTRARRELRSQLAATLLLQLRTRFAAGAGHAAARGISGDYSALAQSQFAHPQQHAAMMKFNSDDHIDSALAQVARIDYLKAIGVLLRCLQRPSELLNGAHLDASLSLDAIQTDDLTHNVQMPHPPTLFSILVRLF